MSHSGEFQEYIKSVKSNEQHFHRYKNYCKFSGCKNIWQFRIRGNFISDFILVTLRGGISWDSITICRTRASLDKKGQLTPQGSLLRPPDLCSQGHLYDVSLPRGSQPTLFIHSGSAVAIRRRWTYVSSRWKAFVGLWVVEIAQKFQSLCSLGLKSHPTQGFAVEHSIWKFLFLTWDSFSVLLSLLAWYDFFQEYLDSLMLSTKQHSTWVYANVFQTPTCCIFLA